MARYFFHVAGMRNTDDEGEELPDSDAARDYAVTAAREIISEHALEGRDCADWTMVAADQAGETLFTLRLGDTVTK